MTRRLRLGVFVTHPVQYHVPIWRALANAESVDLNVFFFSRQGVVHRYDPGFGREVAWDQDLLGGYKNCFLTDVMPSDFSRVKISDSSKVLSCCDVILLHGYTHSFARQIVQQKKSHGFRVILRGEFSDRFRHRQSLGKRIIRDLYLKWFYHHVDAFCYVGEDARQHLLRRRIEPERLFFSPYCVDSEYLTSRMKEGSKRAAREKLGIGEEKVVFLFSGKFIERKNPLFLARLALDLSHNPRFFLIMLGEGPLHNLATQTLSKLIMDRRALLPGFVNQSQLDKYFSAADVFAFPSHSDTWGLVVNEAMHFGLPCIVTDRVGASADLIINNDTGYILPDNDYEQWRTVLNLFLESPNIIADMGVSAKHRVASYTPANAANGILRATLFACQH